MYFHLFLLLAITIVLGVILHIIVSRFVTTKTLHLNVFIIFNLLLFACIFIAIAFKGTNFSLDNIGIAIIFTNSFCLLYCFILVGVVSDSPTLAIVKAILIREEKGLDKTGIQQLIDSHPFVGSRIDALVETGDVIRQDDTFILSKRIHVLLKLLNLYRSIIKIERETG